jgi:2-polyprenyl-3-methyl-5-hydroxy-6-metoxy-1,4-benzoquinol methylase
MEHIACPISGSTEFDLRYRVPDRFALEKGEVWHIVSSRVSGLVMLNPRPLQHEIAKFYEALDYDPFITLKSSESLQDWAYKFVRRFISLRYKARAVLQRMPFETSQTYNVLEIGCATGDFLLELKRQSPATLNLMGIEVSEKAARYAREENELNVFHGELLTVAVDELQDLIVMWHTLEHIHRLSETLDKLHSLLKPNGILVTAMPNLDSLDAQHYGKYWVALDAPRHLYHFTPKSFAALLKKHRLAIVDMHALPLDSYYNALLSEQLCAAAKGQSAGIGAVIKAIIWGSLAAIHGVTPELASSICYYVQRMQ